MIIKWGLIFALLTNIVFIFGDFRVYFADFPSSLMVASIIGFVIGVIIRKWIFRTFWE